MTNTTKKFLASLCSKFAIIHYGFVVFLITFRLGNPSTIQWIIFMAASSVVWLFIGMKLVGHLKDE